MRSKCVLNKNNKNINPNPRTQTQKLKKKKKKTNKSLSLRNFHFQTRKIIWKWNFLGRDRVPKLHFWVRRLWCCACRQSLLVSATAKPSRPARRAQCNVSPEERQGPSWSFLAGAIRRRGRSEVGIFRQCEAYSDEEDKNRRHKNKPRDAIDVKIHGKRKVLWIQKRERQWREFFFVAEKLSLSN